LDQGGRFRLKDAAENTADDIVAENTVEGAL
jgi:hypothetical protein